MASVKFRISSGLKSIIGRDLITNDFVAIFELVKNSFDAKATHVKVVFDLDRKETAAIYVVDNGKGMSASDVENKWLFVAGQL
jgi:DNA mismatch repair ATPase MutL